MRTICPRLIVYEDGYYDRRKVHGIVSAVIG